MTVEELVAIRLTDESDAKRQETGSNPPAVLRAPFVGPDVGIPPALANSPSDAAADPPLPTLVSGFDMSSLIVMPLPALDALAFFLSCVGDCGDADADGDPDVTSRPSFVERGARDEPHWQASEYAVIALDTDGDVFDVLPSFVPGLPVPWDILIGIPAVTTVGGATSGTASPCVPRDAPVPTCLGVYSYNQSDAAARVSLGQRAAAPVFLDDGVTPWPIESLVDEADRQGHDQAWVVYTASALLARFSGYSYPLPPGAPLSLYLQAGMGSAADAGIGDDWIPGFHTFVSADFPCAFIDECDICLGDGTTCADCEGIPNGPTEVDACGVCGGPAVSEEECPTTTQAPPPPGTVSFTAPPGLVTTTTAKPPTPATTGPPSASSSSSTTSSNVGGPNPAPTPAGSTTGPVGSPTAAPPPDETTDDSPPLSAPLAAVLGFVCLLFGFSACLWTARSSHKNHRRRAATLTRPTSRR
jgi:hypothetical protein